ncbi:calcium-transporting ATPase 10, plasma membrane-type-like [Tasmannia lanceolata]|uniref:calcium-transporting ATPase 10, plasma membrane-type-like n=1 Tax=Tasmannia lanceolata TaxID=3420 RepID=UPI004063626D
MGIGFVGGFDMGLEVVGLPTAREVVDGGVDKAMRWRRGFRWVSVVDGGGDIAEVVGFVSFSQQATLVLNASRRFRYTLDLRKEEEKENIRRKIRAHAQVIRAAFLFKEAGQRVPHGTSVGLPVPGGGYGIGLEQLAAMTMDQDFSALQEYGGVEGIGKLLKTNLEKGCGGDDSEILRRRNAFGVNTYPRKKGQSFWIFLWEAWQDLTLIILVVAAAAA